MDTEQKMLSRWKSLALQHVTRGAPIAFLKKVNKNYNPKTLTSISFIFLIGSCFNTLYTNLYLNYEPVQL